MTNPTGGTKDPRNDAGEDRRRQKKQVLETAFRAAAPNLARTDRLISGLEAGLRGPVLDRARRPAS